jgi:hypothetical protein
VLLFVINIEQNEIRPPHKYVCTKEPLPQKKQTVRKNNRKQQIVLPWLRLTFLKEPSEGHARVSWKIQYALWQKIPLGGG